MKTNQNKKSNDTDPSLEELLEEQQLIRDKKSRTIEFKNPILWRGDDAVIFPNTINIIQGQAGTHKSRLAETVCSVLLKKERCDNLLLRFKSSTEKKYAVCYVDTERNLSEQLPYSLQQIQLKAGFQIEDHPYGFDYVSLLKFSREERFTILNAYLEHVRKQFNIHVFVVLDVVTDCIFNFNDAKDSMRLIDLMNQSINLYDVTFLCLIHENPSGGDKARGHLGTELRNKASTVLQIALYKSGGGTKDELLRVTYLKCRNSKKHEPFFVHFSDKAVGLVLADEKSIQKAKQAGIVKAEHAEILELLPFLLPSPLQRKALLQKLCAELGCRERTVETRLRDIVMQEMLVTDGQGNEMLLRKSYEEREIVYFLEEIRY